MGEHLLGELTRLVGDHSRVGNVRGKGLMLFVEPVTDRGTKEKFDPAQNIGGKLQAATRERGLIVRCTNDGIAMAPPLIVTKEQCDTIASAVAESVAEVLGSV